MTFVGFSYTVWGIGYPIGAAVHSAGGQTQRKLTKMAETTETKRKSVCTKLFVSKDGSESRSATPSWSELRFSFANGNTHVVEREDHNADVRRCLEGFGISEKYGNSYAGAKGDADAAEEMFLSMQEQLKAGTWVERAEGVGPRPSLIADAIIAALMESNQKVDNARANAIREKVKDKAVREGALKDPVIKKHFELAKIKRAQERLDATTEKAKGQKVTAEGF